MTGALLERETEAMATYAPKVVLRGQRPTTAFYAFLRSYMDQELGGSITSLSAKLGLRYGVVSRWLEPIESKRTTPSPDACLLIAEKFGEDPISVFRMAGYLPEKVVIPPRPPWDDDLRELFRRGKRIARRADSEAVWELLRPAISRDIESWGQLVDDFQHIVERREVSRPDGST